MKYILGLTGPTGSGKTTACDAAKELGYQIINCDLLARKAVEEKDALDALTRVFGKDILDESQNLNRKALAKKAFESKDKTELLNATLLPFVVKLIKEEIEKSKKEKILLDAPTLYESGAHLLCNDVVAVIASIDSRKARILKRDNLSEEEATLRLGAGKSEEYYKEKTEHIIYNNGDQTAFTEEFKAKLKFLEEK